MCGIAGFINANLESSKGSSQLSKMLNAIHHRGPDSQGQWQEAGAFLGHKRLSIVDLSPAGHQPMVSRCERYILVFNGEIYNYESIKLELESIGVSTWQGHSDTEVLLAAISTWGMTTTLSKLNGMFAFVLWDRKARLLSAARDRFGEKPFYFYDNKESFYFASELSALETCSELTLSIDRNALCGYFEKSYIAEPHSIYQQVKKLPPGHYLQWQQGSQTNISPYWRYADSVKPAQASMITDPQEAISALDQQLKQAVSLRMVSDVPLGAFLSGGIDSATIVSMMQAQSSQPIKTFTLGFDVPGYNEADQAKQISQHLGTDHTEHYVTANDALNVVSKLGGIIDEPFADASIIPTFLVSEMAKKQVTVCLSGDGGDELFAGYRRYPATMDLWRKMRWIPARGLLSSLLIHAPLGVLETLFSFLGPAAKKYSRDGALGPKLRRLGEWLTADNIDQLYSLSMTHWKNAPELVLNSTGSNAPWSEQLKVDFDSKLEAMIYDDALNYLPGDILTKVDRAAMAVSLEGRIPMLDHNLAEFSWRIPQEMKWRDNTGKWLLRQVLYQYVPQKLMDQPKMGFGVPIHQWLRADLKEWACDLLSHQRLSRQKLLNADIVQSTLTDHLSGHSNNAAYLWDVLMLQVWLDTNPKRKASIK
ncbi:asparagine synthase (glutamine-hydrolyzing) [Litorilituus lipolyticus]|uniref:asparagine synthase (glutamine-hydrolyzing) n=1 Tax=Litorilituus lipolyticus TaxID=2491017 RepID=A0A502LGB9_9GAMM|nr:asparagine synthase (glutamine-hydrolyzing) [Litorilituus lipolyticus]TPH18947.1 asparagine synthase (glutamine-hydrolyzing) [Litorilituus lipolyticus]